MAFYQTRNDLNTHVINVDCEQCSATQITNIDTFYVTFEVTPTGETKISSTINFQPQKMGVFNVTPPGSNMTFLFIGQPCVKKVIGAVSLGTPSTLEYIISYPTASTFQVDFIGLSASFKGTMSFMIEYK